MFESLMSILKRGGAVTVDQMACELDTTQEVVAGMIDHMVRMGWLRQMSISCDAHCSQCVLFGDCQRPGRGRVWQVGG